MEQLSLLDLLEDQGVPYIDLAELFEAYFSCRSNKRGTMNALAFEVDYEHNLVELCEEINDGTYHPGRSLAFTINKPVKREIFAADFRDRVVHHLIFNKLNPLFERSFIYDSYACRVGKGTKLGIHRLDGFIRKCSKNYSRNCYVLKLDIRGFFMHINRNVLLKRLSHFIEEKYVRADKALLLDLCKKIIHNDPAQNCTIKGKLSDWDDLPSDKSLFHSSPHCGLPIGNLTSQVLANFYMNDFDHFIKRDLGIQFYGRYVDDFVMVHEHREYLKALVPRIATFLHDTLKLKLHPKKIYLQPFTNGVSFLGVFLKPHRIYMNRRNKGNFYAAIARQNKVIANRIPTQEDRVRFLSSINSYLGLMRKRSTYKLRKKMLCKHLSPSWLDWVFISGPYAKVVLKK